MSLGVKVARNSLFLIAAEPFRRIISIVAAILLVRHLSVSDYGVFGFADALVGIVGVLVNFGTSSYLTREIAKNPERSPEMIGDVMAMQLFTFILVAVGIYGFCLVRGYDALTVQVIMLVLAGLLFADLADTIDAVFEGQQRMEFPAILSVLGRVIAFFAVLGVVLLDRGVVELAGFYAIGDLLLLIASYYFVVNYITRFKLRLNFPGIWKVMRSGAPFMAISALWLVAFHIDKVMIHEMMDEKAVGYYNAAYRLFETMIALPMLIGQALYPAFSEQVGKKDREGMRLLFDRSMRIFAMTGIPLCVGVVFTGPLFIVLFFGDKYAPAGLTLSIFGGILWMWFISNVTGWALTALNRLRIVFIANAVAMLVNISANLILIPRLGYNGAAIATGLSEIVLVVIYCVVAQRTLRIYHLGSIPFKPLLAGLAMGGLIWWLLGALEPFGRLVQALVTVPSAAAAYLLALFVLKGFGEPERAVVRLVLKKFKK